LISTKKGQPNMRRTNFVGQSVVRFLAASAAVALAVGAVGCSDDEDMSTDSGAEARDSAVDAKLDAAKDVQVADVGRDVAVESAADAAKIDAALDAGVDVVTVPVSDASDAAPRADADAAAVPEASTGGDASDARTADATVADVSAVPDASVADVSVVDVSVVDTGTDSGRDAAVEASTADVTSSADAAAEVATTADTGSSTDGCVPNAACLACENNVEKGCPEFVNGCDAFSGTAKANCLALVKCIRDSSCHTSNTLDCYCGTADATQCLATSGAVIANGACKALIEVGQGTTNPTAIQNAYTDIQNPAGAAMQLMLCDNAVCSENHECIPYGPTCP